MFHLHLANRTESLCDALLETLAIPPADPFAADPVIVPNAALRRWLTLAIAERAGICAQVDFAFLGQWIWRQMGRLVPIAERSPFAADTLTWRLHALLDTPARVPAPLAEWSAAADGPQRLALAAQIAAVFDTYVTYRGDWLSHWQAGRRIPGLPAHLAGDETWQRQLWALLQRVIGAGSHHPAEAFVAALAADPAAARTALPRRVAVFAPPAIAPLYLGLLTRLADVIDVHILALNPCREYWTDTVDARTLARLTASGRDAGFELGPPLLAHWGKQTRALVGQLIEAGSTTPTCFDDERTVVPAAPTRLAALQRAILDFRPLDAGSLAGLPASDRSLELHGAHALTRQVEVLHDQLLAAFAEDPTLTPGQVLVACADLDATAPIIDAVFGAAPGNRQIPYTLSGRAEHAANPVAEALLALLALAGGRVPASALGDLLRRPLLARRFGLDAADTDRIHTVLAASGFRWGLDATHRARLDAPPADPDDPGRHTLADGLHRLLLGLMLDPGQPGLVAGSWPLSDADDADLRLADALASLADALRALCARLARPAPAPRWPEHFLAVLHDWLVPADEDEWAHWQAVRQAIEQFRIQLDAAAAEHPLDFATAQSALTRLLGTSAQGGVVTGCVTVSALPAFRGVPARVIALVGIDDGVFPGRTSPAEFDLIAATARDGQARPGDQQRRDDDRNLFLDLLLAARDRLLVFHTHRSLRDNTPLPHSPVLAELIEALLPALCGPGPDGTAEARRRLFVEHPLHPFSASLFSPAGDRRLGSYAAEYQPQPQPGPPYPDPVAASPDPTEDGDTDAPEADTRHCFADAPLRPPDTAERRISLTQLARFLRHPARAWLARLGIALDGAKARLDDDETFAVDPWQVQELWPALLPLAETPTALAEALAASGQFPAGPLGGAARARAAAELRRFAGRLHGFGRLAEAPTLLELAVMADGCRWTLIGDAGELGRQRTAAGGILWSPKPRHGRDRLDHMLAHLAANAAGDQTPTIHLDAAGSLTLPPLATAAATAQLTDLLTLYAAGQRAPLPFFLKSSLACADHLAKKADRIDPLNDPAALDAALRQARKVWAGTPDFPGEAEDDWIRQAWRGLPMPIDAPFAELAWRVWGTVLQAAEESS